jgi:AraC-like DNA-binding protein
VINSQGIKVMGPVSKKYRYSMAAKGKIIGVKFNLGVLTKQLPQDINLAVNNEFRLSEIFDFNLSKQLVNNHDDQAIIQQLGHKLTPYVTQATPSLLQTQALVNLIKQDTQITKVAILAEITNTPIRSIQRLFKEYIGLAPKWLIRKYRLHQVLELLENQHVSLADLATQLDYSDQSHLIRDFKDFLNITPSQYR